MSQPVRLVREVFLTVAAVLGVVCIAATLAALVLDVRPLVFRSGSMAPTIDTGALAVARTVDARDLVPGDIVSVTTRSGARVTHRLVETAPDGGRTQLTLKGDANTVPDEEVYVVTAAEKVLFDVPQLGYVVDAATSPLGLFVLGFYVAGLLVLLLRRKPPGDGDSRPGRRKSTTGARRSIRRSVAAGSAAMLLIASPAAAVPWTDAAPVTGAIMTAYTVVKPAEVSCTVNNPVLGTKSLTTTWQASSTPHVLTYTAVARESGTALTVIASGANRSVTVTGDLLGTLLGNTFNIDITASLPGTGWKATSTRTGTLVLLGLGFSCGAWS